MEATLMYQIRRPFGGAYLHLLNNVIAASRAGFDVFVDLDEDMLNHVIADLKFLGLEVRVERAEKPRGLRYARAISLKYDAKLLRMGVDVLELNSMPLWLAAEGASGAKGALRYGANLIRDVIVRALAYASKTVVTVSRRAAQLLKRDLGLHAISVPNQPLPGFGKSVGAGDKICFPSSYYYSYQGLDVFIRAVKKLGIEDKVLLIGKAKVGGVESAVAFGLRELAEVYSRCLAIVSPHRDTTPVPFFGSPTKVVDALATNKYLIASDLPSIRETIERNLKSGWNCVKFVKPGDVHSLGEALEEVLRTEPSCRYELKEGPITELWKDLYRNFASKSA
ncbi:MAG: glycosyltransferase family 4 protein [Crenarchaeota archaeon]|nr:glycosyltransferase family 4 protein [Thermoproteota archaeon]